MHCLFERKVFHILTRKNMIDVIHNFRNFIVSGK